MYKLGLVSLMMVASCGGGSSAPVDPASLDACLAWANGVCRMAYCPNGYTPSLASTCLVDMRAASCAVVNSGGDVPSCDNACKQ